MQRVDGVIAALGVLAIVATVVGVALYESGRHDLSFPVVAVPLEERQGTGTSHEFAWATPDNATGASFTVTVSWEGQLPSIGREVRVVLELVGPDGAQTEVRETLVLAPGDLSRTADHVIAADWAQPPEPQRGEPAELRRVWEDDIVLRVTLEQPGSPLPGGSFTVAVAGDAHVYHHVVDRPDVRRE